MPRPQPDRLMLMLIATAFFAWGLLRAINDVLAASLQLRASSGANPFHDSEAMLIHSSFFFAYLLFPLPAAALVRRFGLRAGLPAAAALMAAGAAACTFSLERDVYTLALPLFVIAAGIAVLQTTASPSITLLGPPQHAARRFLIAQGFTSLGSVLAPIVALWRPGSHTSLTTPGQTRSAVLYAAVACLLLTLAIAFARVQNPRLAPQPPAAGISSWTILRMPHMRFAALGIFLYVGTEATILSHIVPYNHAINTTGTIALFQGAGLSIYWTILMFGRIFAVWLVRRARLVRMLQTAALVAAALLLLAFALRNHLGSAALFLTGFANAVIFPLIFTLATAHLSKPQLTAASGVLITAICGGAALPILSATLADHQGFFFVLLPSVVCYLWIAATASRCTLRLAES